MLLLITILQVCNRYNVFFNYIFILATILQPAFVLKQLTMKGFLISNYADRYDEGLQQLLKWCREGKLKYKEAVTEGFENLFDAFISMLEGKNIGKAVVKV